MSLFHVHCGAYNTEAHTQKETETWRETHPEPRQGARGGSSVPWASPVQPWSPLSPAPAGGKAAMGRKLAPLSSFRFVYRGST